MVCKSNISSSYYNYTFIEGGKVLLENMTEKFSVLYEDWVNEYYVVDKWKTIETN